MTLTADDINKMKAVKITEVSEADLTDLNEIVIDTKKPVLHKLAQFASQTNNLYINKVGDYIIKVSYAENGSSINDKMKEYLSKLAEVNY